MTINHDDVDWLIQEIGALTDKVSRISPSEWAEKNRYLPDSVTSAPGFFQYSLMPPLREIVDNMDVRSRIREVSLMKGVQIGGTTGVLENAIGYVIAEVKTAPSMFLTADADMAKLRIDSYIVPMIQQSGLSDRLEAADKLARKSAKTDKKIEWKGGGFLLPFGANSSAKLRSFSIMFLFEDEIDSYKAAIRDGDPCRLAEDRTTGFRQRRKIFRLSTPGEKGSSKIEPYFLEGDQRYYNVACKHCNRLQPLKFTGEHEGKRYGLVFEHDEHGNLISGSVKYLCKYCQGEHIDADKYFMLSPASGAKWIPTAKPKSDEIRSYHLSALYSPPIMFKWDDCVTMWLDAWDVVNNRVRDINKLKIFYNNVIGETFEVKSNRVQFSSVSAHRRLDYASGIIPNNYSMKVAGAHIYLLTCAVDVHPSRLEVGVIGWTAGKRAFLIELFTFEGNCKNVDDDSWHKLRDLLRNKVYKSDDGRVYRIQTTLVDSSDSTDTVYSFCSEYEGGVFAIKGRSTATRGQRLTEFGPFTTALGLVAYNITVNIYKDRWSTQLRREWSGVSYQPVGHFNMPNDIPDDRVKELTCESKKEVINKETGQREGWTWHRPSGSRNELWDLLIYNSAALDMVAHHLLVEVMGHECVDWQSFFELAAMEETDFWRYAA